MGTFDGGPGVTADDGYSESNDNFVTGNVSEGVGASGSTTFDTFCRCPNVTVPQGATIDVASLDVTENLLLGTAQKSNIYLEDADDAVAPTTRAEHVADVRTTAFLVLDDHAFVDDVEERVPGLEAVVQEIVDRGSWVSGNAMMILWDNDGTAVGNLYRPSDIDHGGGNNPMSLHIEYTEAGAGGYATRPRRGNR